MSLTQEKPLENNFTNNNDHSYLHKKFKKMASSISVFPTNTPRVGETKHTEESTTKAVYNPLFSYGNIALTQEQQENQATYCVRDEKRVHTILFDDSSNNSDKTNLDRLSGQTSFTDELSNKTENLENDFTRDTHVNGTNGRYICPYCKLPCAKPSVLQKHIRAHTNERPYPCIPCGFAFKTKSNLYKHRRSRAHALKLQGADLSANDEDLSGGSESDSSLPTTSISDVGSEFSLTRLERTRSTEFSSPEITSDRITPPSHVTNLNENRMKSIYKPKFRAAFYPENEDKDKKRKSIPQNADFLTEHISKIISDNEAIVDVIETPLQKKYGKIKQIAESKLNDNFDVKSDSSPLNLTKNSTETEKSFRKRSHSDSFSQNDPLKHPLNPEGSIIKDLLLKNKMNGMSSIPSEQFDGPAVYICQLCQFIFRSADNLEIHRLYYCNPNSSNNIVAVNNVQKEFMPSNKRDTFSRSNSINLRLSETQSISANKPNLVPTSHLKQKPDNIVIIKPETNDVIAPLPSPGPLLGNTRLVDSRMPLEHNKKGESSRVKSTSSPKRKIDSNSDTYSPRLSENISPRATDLYQQSKIRCIESNLTTFRSLEEISQHMRQNSTSLQMFGGEVKILDHTGGTTTLRIEPSKNQLSPILIQPTLSPSKLANDAEASSVVVRSGLHSGGTMVHNPPTPKEIISAPHTPRISLSSTPSITNQNNMLNVHDRTTHFQFPPFNAITAFNPLTLPPLSPSSSPNGATTILHGGKLIPHVPGIPGPNSQGFFAGNRNVQTKSTLCNNDGKISKELKKESNIYNGAISQSNPIIVNKFESLTNNRATNMKISQSELDKKQSQNIYKFEMIQNPPNLPIIKVKNVDEHPIKTISSNPNKLTIGRQEGSMKRNSEGLPRSLAINSGNFSDRNRNNDKSIPKNSKSLQESEIRNFNFETLITKAEIYNNQVQSSTDVQKNTNAQDITIASTQNERSETAYFQKNNTTSVSEDRKPKFLRPTSLPLKPGTFTPKKHHGITPNANTMPLISPETPRPAKAYGQLYLNGNAYTYLGLKCSTKVFYCTINRPQPTYVPNQHFLSMYSNWQLLSELTPDPLGLSASTAMSLYDSRHRPQNASIATIKQDLILTHSSQWNKNLKLSKQVLTPLENKRNEENKVANCDVSIAPKKELAGGFESNEEYTYVRGRGRGRYVCLECGIRCKKPSMLKKHIRTHTDVRPYTCIHCAFSFKTKGNLTKHMKSKAHYKKCCELGINPNEGNDSEGPDIPQGSGETDDDTESDGDEGNEGETESSDTEMCKSQLPEHEAARCLLSLGNSMQMTSATPGLITSARPSTYPYTPKGIENLFADCNSEKMQECLDDSNESKSELDNEPIDLSKNDIKVISNNPEIPTARESSVLASLASNTAKLPQHQHQWTNGEPMLHTYLTERALLDTKIKQSQLTTSLSKTKKVELESPVYTDNKLHKANNIDLNVIVKTATNLGDSDQSDINNDEVQSKVSELTLPVENNIKQPWLSKSQNSENAKNVVSEYLKHARINLIKSREDVHLSQVENGTDVSSCAEENSNIDDTLSEPDTSKPCNIDHDPIARKVVIGAGGVAFKVSKGKDYENSTYSPGRLMEDGRRVCDFCSKTFTKPSQLRLHLNIHYMERPFRCSACAVSFRTRGHLQKHERSGSHHNKVSMTSTFGAATSSNPRPFRCSDCNIAFRIHGHLAKHLRSKMHVMRLECLFKLPFGTFTEIERAGVSLTDIDTTDCESSLTSLQSLARKLHEKDPSKLEYRDPNGTNPSSSVSRELLEEDENSVSLETACDSEKSVAKTIEQCENRDDETDVSNSATEKHN